MASIDISTNDKYILISIGFESAFMLLLQQD